MFGHRRSVGRAGGIVCGIALLAISVLSGSPVARGQVVGPVRVTVAIELRGNVHVRMRGMQVRVWRYDFGKFADAPFSTTALDISPGSPNCGGTTGVRTCHAEVPAPSGRDYFIIWLYEMPPPEEHGYPAEARVSDVFSIDTVVDDSHSRLSIESIRGGDVPVTVTVVLRGERYLATRSADLTVSQIREDQSAVSWRHTFSTTRVDVSPESRFCVGNSRLRTCTFAVEAPIGLAQFDLALVAEDRSDDQKPPSPAKWSEAIRQRISGPDSVSFEPEPLVVLGIRKPSDFAAILATIFGMVAAGIMATAFRCAIRRPGRAIILQAVAVPPSTGIAIKLWLDAHGQSTIPWLVILGYSEFIVLVTVVVAAPLIALGIVANRVIEPDRRMQRWLFGGATVGMVTVMTLASVQLLWNYDPWYSTLAAPLMWPALVAGAMCGAAAGCFGGLLKNPFAGAAA